MRSPGWKPLSVPAEPGCGSELVNYERSRYTLWAERGCAQGILANTLTGAIDLVPAATAKFVATHRTFTADPPSKVNQALLLDRGYYVDSRRAESTLARWLSRKIKEQAGRHTPPKYVLGLTLQCNLACRYCWQLQEHGPRRHRSGQLTGPMADRIFKYIGRDLLRRGKSSTGAMVSLFGGEPLLDTPATHRLVRHIGKQCQVRGMQLHFTTNGKTLAAFEDEVTEFNPSIQVTVDGAQVDSREVCLCRAGQPLTGVYETLAAWAKAGHGQMMLRFLATPASVDQFVALADAIFSDRRFANHFTLAVAPVQEKSHSTCSGLAPKTAVLQALLPALSRRAYASKIAFLDWRSLGWLSALRASHRQLAWPAFYHCEANIDLTGFDHRGQVYACFEAIGDPRFAVGTYWPKVTVHQQQLARFHDRTAFNFPLCRRCALSPLCGGGCQVRSYKKTANHQRPYCDDLHAEMNFVLTHWPEISRMLLGTRSSRYKPTPAPRRQPNSKP